MNVEKYQKLLLFLKVIIIVLLTSELYYHFTGKDSNSNNKKIVYWEDRINFIFTILMAILIIYLFLPGTSNKTIDNGTKFTLVLFAIVLIVKSNWYNFITDSVLFKAIRINGKK